jgi:hypothetical protein
MTSAIGGIVGGIGSLVGGSEAASGQQAAASTEAAAEQAAVAAEQQDFGVTEGNLAPFVGYGTEGITDLLTEMNTPGFGGTGAGGGPLGAIPNITDPSQLPGYQFTLGQGEQAVNNAATAQGLGGRSGPLMKSITSFATGLANSSYGQFLQNYWTNQNNRYNMLYNQVLTGQAAAANVGQAATSTGGNVASSTLSGAAGVANAQGAAATATGAGISGASNQFGNALTAALLTPSGSTVAQPAGYSGLTAAQANAVNTQGYYFNPDATTGTG